ncbi:MAG TPA: glycoside hydrolase family 9 protein [Spirochaetota bacterium]|nr:glycoside hydrolase family 9 protein [Spirochaetota bacterium]
MKKIQFMILCISAFMLLISCGKSKKLSSDKAIRAIQTAFYPESPKYFVAVGTDESSFEVHKTGGGAVFSGKLEKRGIWDLSNEDVKNGNFTDLKEPGEYIIKIKGLDDSFPFKISKEANKETLKASVKAFYYQRCSIPLKEKHAGLWKRNAGHPDLNLQFDKTVGKEGRKSVPGGWYDAGDYGKYVVNAGISCQTLLSLYELYPSAIGDDLNIPESGNGKSDLLDEIKYELDWFKTMQDSDGGVFFKVATNQWPAMVMPEDDKIERLIIGKSTTSTLNFAASMAQAGRVYKDYNPAYAADCIKRAEAAVKWAEANPNIKEPDNTNGSGPYEDTDFSDEFLAAYTELFITTGKEEYAKQVENKIKPDGIVKPAEWQNLMVLAYHSIALTENTFSENVKNNAKKAITLFADNTLSEIKKNPYRIPINKHFRWGSNSDIANYGISLIYAYRITKDKKYLYAASEMMDYIFGRNAVNYCFMGGFGSNPVVQPHHRPSSADGVKPPVPGLIAGGANQGREDGQTYFDYSPAKCYTDVGGAYSCNEIAINWNAPVAFILGALESEFGK